MNKNILKHIVIKPTLACTANCSTCGTRKMLHNGLIAGKDKMLTLDDWKVVLNDAYFLGAKRVDISGGEPMIYKNLVDLVKIGNEYGWHVNINTNGSLVTEEKASELVDAGLSSMYISLYSHDACRHDSMRNKNGLWQTATKSIGIFAKLQNEKFSLKTQTLIDNVNFRDLPYLIRLHREAGVSEMAVSYLEGDINGEYLMSEDEIDEFRTKIIPRCINELKDLSPENKEVAISSLKNMFSDKISDQEWSSGAYRPSRIACEICSRPSWFALILANGDVHPCNAVEYTHEPIMGNVLDESLIKIWSNKKYDDFRKNTFSYCERCPINLYTVIPLK